MSILFHGSMNIYNHLNYWIRLKGFVLDEFLMHTCKPIDPTVQLVKAGLQHNDTNWIL